MPLLNSQFWKSYFEVNFKLDPQKTGVSRAPRHPHYLQLWVRFYQICLFLPYLGSFRYYIAQCRWVCGLQNATLPMQLEKFYYAKVLLEVGRWLNYHKTALHNIWITPYLCTRNFVKHSLLLRVGLYSRVEFNTSQYSCQNGSNEFSKPVLCTKRPKLIMLFYYLEIPTSSSS